ncbi:MAG: hypothetical protein MK116_13385 [Phycisphaerales bacterium]|nr:hypothetical protein [Phycisphaerales bacterium]
MMYKKTLAAIAATAIAGTALAEFPDPNPRPNPDGTNTWYVGNNTQYPVIQDVLNACADGDEIVVNAGLYVESLEIVNNDVTLRPFSTAAGNEAGGVPQWSDVVFWNPTEGFNNANGYAMRMTGGDNTYVGEPRQYTELANNYESLTIVPLLNTTTYANIGNANTSAITLGTPAGSNNGGGAQAKPAGMTFSFESRSIDNVAIYSTDGRGTFQRCYISTQNGYGGGIICTGDDNETQFVSCTLDNLLATGNPLMLSDGTTGPGCNVITVTAGRPMFLGAAANCANDPRAVFTVGATAGRTQNFAGPEGIISVVGGRPVFDGCDVIANFAPTADGTIMVSGESRTNFARCNIANNTSRFGTFYWDAAGQIGPEYCNFMRCNFTNNATANQAGTGQMAGGIAWCDGMAYGSAPLLRFSECGSSGNNGSPANSGYQNTTAGANGGFQDVTTEWFPICRIGANWMTAAPSPITSAPSGLPGDMNGDGVVDVSDMYEIQSVLGTCQFDGDLNGVIDVNDLLGMLASYGGPCQ